MPAVLGLRAAEGNEGMQHGEECTASALAEVAGVSRSRKRARADEPCSPAFSDEEIETAKAKKPVLLPLRSLDELPNECLFEILRRLSGNRERCASSCVSKRWLGLLSSIRLSEISRGCCVPCVNEYAVEVNSYMDDWEEMLLATCFEGEEATDIRLAAAAVASGLSGGFDELSIRESHPTQGVTDAGIAAVAHVCASLRVLNLWDVPLVTDAGLSLIASECPLLEELDVTQCPLITDKGLIEVAQKCPNLMSLTLESCGGIGNEGLKMIARHCKILKSLTLKNCPLISDKGVSSIIYSSASSLEKIKLHGLNITDATLAVIGFAGKAVTALTLGQLQAVREKGFWVMANAPGLKELRRVRVTACPGMTDIAVVSLAKCCPNLRCMNLQKCLNVSDTGLKGFIEVAKSLESLQLEDCHGITLIGVLGGLFKCSPKLKSLGLVRCLGIKDICPGPAELPLCNSLRSLAICCCPGFTDASLKVVGRICPQLENIELTGIADVTDDGILPLIKSSGNRFVNVDLSGCVNLTDVAVSSLVEDHGKTLKVLNLGGCRSITDASLLEISENCCELVELDLSKSLVSDYGVAVLASARQLNLHILSLSGCENVTQKSVPLLSNMGQSLEGLNLQHCNLIGNRGVVSLEEKLWWCDILA